MMEKYLIEHCSPTLASVKAANLFNACCEKGEDIEKQILLWNQAMKPKGVQLTVLRKQGNRALIYVYREKKLRENLTKKGVSGFLKSCGYEQTEVAGCLEILKERFLQAQRTQKDRFPHEIGIFLDYPLEDVLGFIRNKGKNYKCAGCWKVYCNECEALKQFEKYKKCRSIYKNLWEKGKSVLQLTVAA